MAVDIRFISAYASGGGDGSSGNPWTLAEGAGKVKADRLIKIRPGAYAPAATLSAAVDTTAPTGASPCAFAAVDGSDNIVTSPSGMVQFNFSGLGSGVGWEQGAIANTFFHGLKFNNAPSHGFSTTVSQNLFSVLTMCSANGNGGTGFLAHCSYMMLIDCKATGNAAGGIVRGVAGHLIGCQTSGNTGAAGVSGGQGAVVDCVILDGITSGSSVPLVPVNCLIGPFSNTGIANTFGAGAYASILANMATGISTDGVVDLFNDFYNVTSPVGADAFLSAGRLTTNPEIQNTIESRAANLRDAAFPLTGVKARIGAWQGQAFRSNSVFGGIR